MILYVFILILILIICFTPHTGNSEKFLEKIIPAEVANIDYPIFCFKSVPLYNVKLPEYKDNMEHFYRGLTKNGLITEKIYYLVYADKV